MPLNKYSKTVTQDPSQPASQAQLYATGLKEEDFDKAQVGIVSTGFEGNPCNMHLNILAHRVKKGVQEADLVGLIFHTIGVSDGISNGTTGMKYSLVSRDIIADSIETVCGGQFYDAVIPVVGCDKNMPGALMAMGRLNRPGIMVYGGSVRPGKWKGEDLNIISAFEAYGQKLAGNISDEDYKGIIQNSIPGPGACGGMYTANTMSSSFEALGMALFYSSTMANIDQEKKESTAQSARVLVEAVKKGLKPRDIVTRKSVENAIALVMATGGSTNAVLHYLAICHAAEVEWTLDDFERVRRKVPVICDLKPSGKYMAVDLHKAGGVPQVLKILLNAGLLHGDCMTITGRTLAEELESVPDAPPADQDVIRPIDKALYPEGHLAILRGNLAPEGSVAKITGLKSTSITGPARVFDDEQSAMDAIQSDRIRPGDVLVLRYLGPRGGPGMPEMLAPTSAIIGRGLGDKVGLITDGRFSGGSWGMLVGHVTPEAFDGGPIALVQEGDSITIDAPSQLLQLNVDQAELDKRAAAWRQPEARYKSGVLSKYSQLATSASKGAVSG